LARRRKAAGILSGRGRSEAETMQPSLLAAFCGALLALAVPPVTPSAAADLEAEARQALEQVFEALASGDAARVRPYLAPEFQILRSDGAGYHKEAYLAQSIPKIESEPVFSNIVATRNGDIVVVRMQIEIEEHIDGKKAESVFPHMIVFRVTPDRWQVVAAANFAKLE
jgi:ketosteroid isomerase-like protein